MWKKYITVCPHKYKKFEIITGYSYTNSLDSLATIPGSLELSDCLDKCRQNENCQAINFETGLCILLNSSAIEKPDALKESQFPVFTIYAQKVCISGECFWFLLGLDIAQWPVRCFVSVAWWVTSIFKDFTAFKSNSKLSRRWRLFIRFLHKIIWVEKNIFFTQFTQQNLFVSSTFS